MIQRTALLFLAVTTLFIGSVFILRQFKNQTFPVVQREPLKEFEIIGDEEESVRITPEVLLSSPLVIFGRGNATPFTPSAVIVETNRQRREQGLPALTENSLLNSAAEMKVRDIFEQQYFDHVSPTGAGPDSLARRVGYEYVSIGENLAMGSFGDEGALVEAWMQSPGHRANILRSQFQEIGLAVGRGDYNGHPVLIAVQEFGRPLSSCPIVSSALRRDIDTKKTQLSALSRTLESLRLDLDIENTSSTSDMSTYQNKINLYNNEVTEYNILVAAIKEKTGIYNTEVRAFNNCLNVSL